MHRLGRSAQQKMKDRWGGSFILMTLLALVAAWFAGTWLNENWGKGSTASTSGTSPTVSQTITGDPVPEAVPTGDFSLYFVQTGALRSDSGVHSLVDTLNSKGFTAMVAPRNSSGYVTVFSGVYTSNRAAAEARVKLVTDAGVNDAFIKPVTISHTPAAIPAAAMGNADLRQAVDAMNGYLFEVAAYMENGHMGDVSAISAKGKDLAKLSDTLTKAAASDSSLKSVADLVKNAAANAGEFETAGKAGASAADLQMASTHYLTVLNQYSALTAATPAAAPASNSKSPAGTTNSGSNASGSTNSNTNTGH